MFRLGGVGGPPAGGKLPDEACQRGRTGTVGECLPWRFRIGVGLADDGGDRLRPGSGLERGDAGGDDGSIQFGQLHVFICLRYG